MNIFKYTLLVLLASIMPLSAQLTVPCGTVMNFNVTVDACDILRNPTGANFFDANLDPYVNGLCLVTIATGDIIYILDSTDCLNPKKGNVDDLLGSACAVIGPGTGGFVPIWLGGACSTSIGDSFIRQLCGDILFDDGVNDIVTFDFTTNPTGAISLAFGDVSGVFAIDNCLTNLFLPIATATDGELVDSVISQNAGGKVSLNNNDFHMGGACCNVRIISYDSSGATGLWAVRVSNTSTKYHSLGVNVFTTTCNAFNVNTNATVNGNFTVACGTFKLQNTAGANKVIVSDTNISGTKNQEFSNLNGNIPAVEVVVNMELTADDQVILPTGARQPIISDDNTAANRTFTLDLANMVEGLLYTFQWNSPCGQGELLDTGVYKLTADWRPDDEGTLSGYTDQTSFWETGRSAN